MAQQASARYRTYRFDRGTLDTAKRELHRDGQPVATTPSVFDCIAYLVAQRERAVGRDELIAAIWGRTQISDSVLRQTIMHARRAVGDDARRQEVIRTLSHFGYRWMADTTEGPVAAGAVSTIDSPDTAATGEEATQKPQSEIEPASATRPAVPESDTTVAEVRLPDTATSRGLLRGRSRAARILGGLGLLLLVVSSVLVALVWRAGPQAPDSLRAADRRAALPAPSEFGLATGPWLIQPVQGEFESGDGWQRLGLAEAIRDMLHAAEIVTLPAGITPASGAGMASASATTLDALGARALVEPRIERDALGWKASLRLLQPGRATLEASADDDDEIAAMRTAALHLLEAVGRTLRIEPAGEDEAHLRLAYRYTAGVMSDRGDEAERWLRATGSPPPTLAVVRLGAANAALELDRLQTAQTLFGAVLADSAADTPQMRGRALLGLGRIAARGGDLAQAESYGRESIAMLARASGSDADLGRAQAHLGVVLANRGRYEEAGDALAEARMRMEASQDPEREALLATGEAVLAGVRGRLHEATLALQRAEEAYMALGNVRRAMSARLDRADMQSDLLEWDQALATSEPLWRYVTSVDRSDLLPMAAAVRLRPLIDLGQLGAAKVLLAALDPRTGAQTFGARYLALQQFRLLVALGEADAADKALDAWLGDGGDVPAMQGEAWVLQLRSLRHRHGANAARERLADMRNWAARSPNEAQLWRWLAEGEQQHAEGRTEEAWPDFEKSLAAAESLGVPMILAQVVEAYASALLASGRLDRAMTVAGRVVRCAERDLGCARLFEHLHRASGDRDGEQRMALAVRRLRGERSEVPPRFRPIQTR